MDVISQGREPKRDFRLPPSLLRRWRIVAGAAAVLVIAAVVAVVWSRHASEAPGARVPGTAAVTPGVPTGGFDPGNSRSWVVCVPSTGVCSVRVTVVDGSAWRMTQSK